MIDPVIIHEGFLFALQGKDGREIFDKYLNTCPHQGSRTIRTEVLNVQSQVTYSFFTRSV